MLYLENNFIYFFFRIFAILWGGPLVRLDLDILEYEEGLIVVKKLHHSLSQKLACEACADLFEKIKIHIEKLELCIQGTEEHLFELREQRRYVLEQISIARIKSMCNSF